ncbi:hypothetical protein [Pedobacter heparinus]|uniref:Uncharacterized protein n=1 Tax=Pedobacter heparinus (strain ATCC 13125 / DSM 2366 / CIP 104194 / JCM 7457 / NBRC 12017 / NCIMB 9290 / NRRL B-14731 / HIM 762-3) TaxID=485917 RepID=C6Y3J2_PEDHD|nr:hypothetical protein [Pedobacter heparinus]ACU03271.1 conserved hypothetical protein [Pedobacter heparinus DSM 2366]
MAIWQYTIEIIPRGALSDLGTSGFITLDDYNNFDFWGNFDLGIEFFDSLTAGLERSRSWSDEIILYGDSESTCIRFFLEESKISGIDVRIDFRYNYSEILNSVIEFCHLNGFVILDNLEILGLNSTFIVHHIEKSEQFITYKRLFGDPI